MYHLLFNWSMDHDNALSPARKETPQLIVTEERAGITRARIRVTTAVLISHATSAFQLQL
jgi:hypothetical protein